MSRDLKVALTISAEDRASDKVRQVGKEAERQAERVGARTKRAAEDTTRFEERTAQRGQTVHARTARAREQLGIRSEQSIRREITQTEAAYNRLARTGRMSATEQTRAYSQMQSRVSSLRREMGGLEQQNQRVGRGLRAGSMALRAGAILGAGAAAGAMILAAPVKRTMDYQSRLSMMANTAFSDRGVEGRLAGRRELNEAINNAVRVGGGKRDDAANTLDSLLSSGAMSHKSAVNLLPTLQKTGVATGADPQDLAQIAIRGMQTFGIAEADIPKALDMAIKAGQEGGFELKDMARWLPKLMAMGKTSGMSGLKDFGSLVAVAQSSLITGGTTDAAGNNLANLLAKINSRDTAKQAEKIEIAPGKSINVAGTLKEAAGKGINSIDAFVGIVDKVVGTNKEFQGLQQQLSDPTLADGDRVAIMEKQASILQGSSIGQLIQDQQALLALVGYMGNRKYVKDIEKTYGNGVDAAGVNHAVMASTDGFKAEQLANERQAAEYEAFQGLTGVIGDTSKALADLAVEYPEMTKWVVGSTEALKALAPAASMAMLALAVRGRAAAGTAAAAGGSLAAGAATAARGTTGGGSLIARSFGKVGAAGPIIAGLGAYDAYGIMRNDTLTPEQKRAGLTRVGMSTSGSIAGAYAGAALGTMAFPGLGTLAGGALGAWGGNYLGEVLGDRIGQALFPVQTPKSVVSYTPGQTVPWANDVLQTMITAKNTPQALDLKVTVDVQNGNIVASVNETNERNARRN